MTWTDLIMSSTRNESQLRNRSRDLGQGLELGVLSSSENSRWHLQGQQSKTILVPSVLQRLLDIIVFSHRIVYLDSIHLPRRTSPILMNVRSIGCLPPRSHLVRLRLTLLSHLADGLSYLISSSRTFPEFQ